LALFERLGERLEADPLATARLLGVALDRIALLRDLPGGPIVAGGEQRVARARHGGEAEHLDGPGRARLIELHAVLVEHRTHTTVRGSADDGVALTQRAGFDEHGRDGAAPLVELRL